MKQCEQQQTNETTTTTDCEQQQQQNVRQPTKLMVKTKGIEITDMKEFLAKKRRKRAALFGNENFKSNLAELHTQQKKWQIQHAQTTDRKIGRDKPVTMGSSTANGD